MSTDTETRTPPTPRIPEFSKGARYRLARETAGYGSGEFAEMIGVSRNTVSAIESDRTSVRKIVANAWAVATGVPAVWLETGVRPKRFELLTFWFFQLGRLTSRFVSAHRSAVSSSAVEL